MILRRILEALLREKELDRGLGISFSIVKRSTSYKVTAKDPEGDEVGYAIFGIKGHQLKVVDVEVDGNWRRRGIASAMYSFAEKETGMKVLPSDDQTADGAALWAGNRAARRFG